MPASYSKGPRFKTLVGHLSLLKFLWFAYVSPKQITTVFVTFLPIRYALFMISAALFP